MIITVHGKEGSGKTTVANMIAKKLGLKSYYMGQIRREMAKRKGMTLEEYNKLGETDPSTDLPIEEYIKKLGEEEDNFIIQTRTAYHFIPQSVKVFLDVDIDEAAKRVYHDLQTKEGRAARNETDKTNSLSEVKKSLIQRAKSDLKRYKKYYGLDIHDKKNFDIVIDTTKIPAEKVAEKIVEFAKKK